MRSVLRLTVAAGLLAGYTTAGRADEPDKPFTDNEFVMKAASGGMYEVEAGKLAKDRAANADVKKFGEKMVADHTKAGDELKDLAKELGIPLSGKVSEEHQKHLDRLKDLRGADFDLAYMKQQVEGHEKMAKMFEKAAKEGKDARLRQWAEKTLPTVKDHLDMAKKIRDGLPKQ
jgi:putative membrane protein